MWDMPLHTLQMKKLFHLIKSLSRYFSRVSASMFLQFLCRSTCPTTFIITVSHINNIIIVLIM